MYVLNQQLLELSKIIGMFSGHYCFLSFLEARFCKKNHPPKPLCEKICGAVLEKSDNTLCMILFCVFVYLAFECYRMSKRGRGRSGRNRGYRAQGFWSGPSKFSSNVSMY